ncbi:MAG: N-acetylmuramoyl-L-alanine amidase [Thermoanaerobaculia bacterium]
MKRLTFVPFLILAIASIVLAQAPPQATLRMSAGDKPLTVLPHGSTDLFAIDEVLAALGGTISNDGVGFKASLGQTTAAFGPQSRFGVIRDDLIEMPVPPFVAEGRVYVPIQFLQGFLLRAAQQDTTWDALSRVLSIRPAQQTTVGVQVSVANIQGTSKVVLTLTAPLEYAIVKEQDAYTVRFRGAIRAPYADQAHEDPYVAKTSFAGSDLRILLTSAEVVADAYRLDNPFRIVLDLHKGAAAGPGGLDPGAAGRAVEQPGIHTIVIDAGHGGKEVGAVGPGGLLEKEATLALCRKLAASLESRLKTRVVMTRTDDVVVPLDQRTAIANQYHADLFLSVHMNAALLKGAHGAETYFLSLEASDELARKAAEVENAAAKAAAVPAAPNDLKLILWDLAQQEYLNESSRLAQAVQEEMNRITGVQNRGVKQAPFKVLVGATMPAVLVEVAFITNPDEESRIRSEEFQKIVVSALTTAVERYKADYETRLGIVRAPAVRAPAAPAVTPSTPAAVAPGSQTTPVARTAT